MNLIKIIKSTSFLMKLVFRTGLIPILFLLLNIFVVYTFYLYRYDTFSPPSALTTSSQLVIAGMLAYLLFGIWIIRIDESSSMKELTVLINNGYIFMFLGKCIIGVISIILGQLIAFAAYFILFYGQPITDYSYFMSVFNYIGVFWSGSFFISYLVGMLLANIIKGKFIYPIALFIYCLLIPINYVFLDSLNRFLDLDLTRWFNLGEPNPHSSYHALYGFSMESVHFWKKLFIMTIILLSFIILFLKKNVLYVSKKLLIIAVIFIAFFCTSLNEIISDKQLLLDESTGLVDYYRSYNNDTQFGKQNIKLENVDILLEPKRHLELKVDFEVINRGESDLDKLYFTLFHEFKVNQIKVSGESVDFIQKGETVEIILNEKLTTAKRASVSFDYAGLQTNLYFGNSQSIYLPNYFPWLPSTNSAAAFDFISNQSGLHRISHKNMEETKYQLVIKYNKGIYTNLNKIADNKWSGISSSGITIISGMLNEKNGDYMNFIYPIAWEDSTKGFKKFETYINTVYDHVKTGLLLDNITKPESVYFLPTLNISDTLIGESTFTDGESIIIGTPVYTEPDRNYVNSYLDELTYEMVPSFTTKDLTYDKQQYEFNILFNNIYAQLINRKIGLNDDTDNLKHVIEYNLTESNEINAVLNELHKWLKKEEASDSQHPIYKEWYRLVHEGKGWDELNELLKNYNNI